MLKTSFPPMTHIALLLMRKLRRRQTFGELKRQKEKKEREREGGGREGERKREREREILTVSRIGKAISWDQLQAKKEGQV